MNLLDIQTQIEDELTWRSNEIRFLRNQLAYFKNEADKKIYRKSLAVMLYSHFEGFTKTAFLIYVQSINQEGLSRKQANNYLATASLAEVFKAYGNTDKKCKIFKSLLPDDSKLHLFARQVDLVAELNNLWRQNVEIPENIVDTESNLKPVVLRKILFRLGFSYDLFAAYEGKIQRLLDLRNSIAHGAKKNGLEYKEYEDIEEQILVIMNKLKELIMNALGNREYLKAIIV